MRAPFSAHLRSIDAISLLPPRIHTRRLVFPAQRTGRLLLAIIALLLAIFGVFPRLIFSPTHAQRLIGVWHAQSLLHQGVRTSLRGIDYEFRSDYTTRRFFGDGFGIQAGLWLIHSPADASQTSDQANLQSTTTITATYLVIDSLARHIESHMLGQAGTPQRNVWAGAGIYEVTLDANVLVLRIPDPETTGWIEITCTRGGATIPPLNTSSSTKE